MINAVHVVSYWQFAGLFPCRDNLRRTIYNYICFSDSKLLNKRNPYLTSMAYYLDFGNCNPHYLVPNCSAFNLEYITRNLVKIKQLCLSIGSARYRGGMVPKVALSYHWITLVKTLILDYTLILLPQYINNGWDHHRQQYILHICGACCGSDAEYCSVVTYPTPPTESSGGQHVCCPRSCACGLLFPTDPKHAQ